MQAKDTSAAARALLRGGPAGVDQATALLADLQTTADTIAGEYLGGVQELMRFSDESPTFTNESGPGGSVKRTHHKWPQRVQIVEEGSPS